MPKKYLIGVGIVLIITGGYYFYQSRYQSVPALTSGVSNQDKSVVIIQEKFGADGFLVNQSAIDSLSEETRALLAWYSYWYPTACEWDGEYSDKRDNLKCVLNDSLKVGYQCSDTQLALLTKYPMEGDPEYNDPSHIREHCQTTPGTATVQSGLEKLSLTILGEHSYTVYIESSAMNFREGQFSETKKWENWQFINGQFQGFNNEPG